MKRGKAKRSAFGFKLEMYNRTPRLMIYKRCMREQRLFHIPFSRLSVADAPAVSKDYAERCIRFLAYVRDATMYYTQRDAAAAIAKATADTTGAATSPRRMCAA